MTPGKGVRQAGVLAVLHGQICLVTSSSGGRWVVPKGGIEPGRTAGETALAEAWEEAGLVGTLVAEPLGSYLHPKWDRLCHVTLFGMVVREAAEVWPERHKRRRVWLSPELAVGEIDRPAVRELVRGVIAQAPAWLSAEAAVPAG